MLTSITLVYFYLQKKIMQIIHKNVVLAAHVFPSFTGNLFIDVFLGRMFLWRFLLAETKMLLFHRKYMVSVSYDVLCVVSILL